jgi:hypothetical protein
VPMAMNAAKPSTIDAHFRQAWMEDVAQDTAVETAQVANISTGRPSAITSALVRP